MYEKFIKRLFDLLFSLILTPIVIIICLLFGILIYIEDRGSVFYIAKRRGLNGKIFNMLKLRSMKMNAPDIRNDDNSTYNSEDDPRVTKIGKFIRKTSIDELPQIFNVLLGDMSMIGPRPITINKPLSDYDKKRIERLRVRPGITGFTQAYYRNNISQEKKLILDAEYAKNVSFTLDLKIFFRTIYTVLSRSNVYMKDN